MVKDGLNAEERDRQERIKARIAERARWAEFQRIQERCIAIAEAIWNPRLDIAEAKQRRLAEEMRDRTFTSGGAITDYGESLRTEGYAGEEKAIPVPLLTPRDRQQFIKEVAAGYSIDARYRNLGALPELKDAPSKSPEGEGAAPEAASGTDELSPVEVAPA